MANRQNFSWGSSGVGTEGVDWGNTNNWNDQQWADYDKQYGTPAAPSTSPAPSAGTPARTNFKWGTAGVGKEGVDWGNTNSWGDKEWADYDKKYPSQSSTAPTQTIDNGPVLTNADDPQHPTPPDSMQQLISDLTSRAHQSLTLDPNDPVIKGRVDAFAAEQTRARRNAQNEAAEAAASQNLGNSGALDNEKRMAGENEANAVGGFESQLMGRELQERRDEISHALDSMGQLLTEEQRQALQKELAQIDDATKRYGIDTQNSQYYAGLSQADRQFAAELAQRDKFQTSDDKFRWAGLSQEGQKWLDQMGFNEADRAAYWDNIRRGNA